MENSKCSRNSHDPQFSPRLSPNKQANVLLLLKKQCYSSINLDFAARGFNYSFCIHCQWLIGRQGTQQIFFQTNPYHILTSTNVHSLGKQGMRCICISTDFSHAFQQLSLSVCFFEVLYLYKQSPPSQPTPLIRQLPHVGQDMQNPL